MDVDSYGSISGDEGDALICDVLTEIAMAADETSFSDRVLMHRLMETYRTQFDEVTRRTSIQEAAALNLHEGLMVHTWGNDLLRRATMASDLHELELLRGELDRQPHLDLITNPGHRGPYDAWFEESQQCRDMIRAVRTLKRVMEAEFSSIGLTALYLPDSPEILQCEPCRHDIRSCLDAMYQSRELEVARQRIAYLTEQLQRAEQALVLAQDQAKGSMNNPSVAAMLSVAQQRHQHCQRALLEFQRAREL
jgi:hypothetical protein